jgi:hypothetical protein
MTMTAEPNFDSPIYMKVNDIVQIGQRLFRVRKITNRDYVLRPLRRDQLPRVVERVPAPEQESSSPEREPSS